MLVACQGKPARNFLQQDNPPALATNIARKEKDVGDRTGGGEMHWKTEGGSVPFRKCPSMTLAVVGYGISRPLFLQFYQQYNPVRFWMVLRNLHARSDGPKVDQVNCLVQLQHHLTCYWSRRIDGRLTVELVPPTTVRASPFLFHPTDEPAAVN